MRRTAFSIALALCAVTCSVPAEQTIVGDFFSASRLRDLTALSRFSTVVFEPAERGTVSSFRIERISPEQVEGGLRTKHVEVTAAVFRPDGRTVDQSLVMRLQKRDDDPRSLYGGWIVTGVTGPDPQSAQTPALTR